MGVVLTRRTNKCFDDSPFLFYFFFLPCDCLFGRVTVCLVFHFLLIHLLHQEKKKVTEDKAAYKKKMVAPGVALPYTTHTQSCRFKYIFFFVNTRFLSVCFTVTSSFSLAIILTLRG